MDEFGFDLTSGGSDFFSELDSIYNNVTEPEVGASDADELLEGLNPEQKEAVQHLGGPLLILAGAGSGKTRVITYRIAYMMKKHNVAPGSILAITFTNKAANEMKERITALVGDRSQYIWCGTFHSIFARILRRHADLIGYDRNFTILDSDDQLKMVKQVMQELDISEKMYKPRNFLYEITNSKNHMVSPEQYEQLAGADTARQQNAKVYKRYNMKLIENNAMDFDDILVNMVKLLKGNPDILEFYRNKFGYIMVDEYQDTNQPQYNAVMLLAKGHNNICVVGDDDQSIYAFRGADVRMILNFEKDFPGCQVIKLEQNYRSTKTILSAANEVIANNKSRKSKALRTEGNEGDKIIVMNADSQAVEAAWTADTIKHMVQKGKFAYSDVAILYRMNALSRSVESALRDKGIPFRIYGGMRFYDRKEIKDTLAYLRLINDSKDDLAFDRIINVPKRGIGDTTVDKIRAIAAAEHVSMMDVARRASQYEELMRSANKLYGFCKLIDEFTVHLEEDEMSFPDFVDYVENESGMIQEMIDQRESKGELTDRVENLKELLSEAAEFEKNHRTSEETDNSELQSEIEDDEFLEEETATADTLRGILALYLENAALYSQGDSDDDNEDYVKLMSIHSSKGLEFGAVFLIGVEDGIFPSYKSIASAADTEEERRLMYVAITRAKKNLFIVLTRQRMLFGQTQCLPPSRFLREINPEHLYRMGNMREVQKQPSEAVNSQARVIARRNIASALSSGVTTKKDTTGGMRSGVAKKPGALSPAEIKDGMKVRHDRFGSGIVIKVEPVAGDALITVDFDGMRKNMLAGTAGLKKGE
ncbi:ATP-dependent DNA helicase PcrA [Ruminococcaceae bacterium KH2T8]|nr:ATP-dependent DNA helicase PcrA [Ruminococcaceae bacterium KH2T8]